MLVFAGTGCTALTREEARESLEEIELASSAEALLAGSVELTTSFTIGEGVERAAQTLRDFVETNLPCADIAVEGSAVTIEYGAQGDRSCVFRGHSYAGRHRIELGQPLGPQIEVTHTWEHLTNQQVEVSGTAAVSWDTKQGTRHVIHNLDWVRSADGRHASGSGARTQRALEDDISIGFEVSGSRVWEGADGTFELDIDSAQMRWVDPVPQAGLYTLETPYGKSLEVSFERKSEEAIDVSLSSGARSFTFTVKRRD